MIKYPEFKSKKEKFDYIINNKEMLVEQKMMTFKRADGFNYGTNIMLPGLGKQIKDSAVKSFLTKENVAFGEIADTGLLEVKSIINTTFFMDSHDDVHIDGLWDKSLANDNDLMLLQEHQMAFNKIIADQDDVKVSLKKYNWKELGFNYDGETQALEFKSNVRKSRNEYMYNQYKDGYVNNHSVGMRYGKLDIAIDDEDYPAHKELFDKYIDKIANKEYVNRKGMFWAIMEADAIEGSAVPKGSNTITPTTSVRSKYFNLGVNLKQEEVSQKMTAYKAFLGLKE